MAKRILVDAASPSCLLEETRKLDKHPNKLLEGLNRLRLNKVFCDVILCCEGQEFPCHRVVLASISSYFQAMFTTAMVESTAERVNMDGVEPEVVDMLLRFAYTSEVFISTANVQALLEGANLMDVRDVGDACYNYMQRHIDTDNCGINKDLTVLSVCKEEDSSEHQERSLSLVQVKPEPPQIKEEQQEMDQRHGPFDARMQPVVKLYRIDFLHLPACKEEEEKNPGLVQEEPEPPHIKEEQQEMLQRPEEAVGSTLTLLAVKHEDDDVNRETEPLASTSAEHMKTQADVEDSGASQPTSDDQLLSSHCSESDTEDSDEWKETREDQSALNKLKSVKAQHVSNKLSQDLKSSKQSSVMRSVTGKRSFNCKECGKGFGKMSNLKEHMRIHTGEKPFTCTVCAKGFARMDHLKTHMRSHTGEKPFSCTICVKGFSQKGDLKTHMRCHTGEKPFSCTICAKGFSQKGDLKTHMRFHTGEKPFSCTFCAKGFTQMCNLKTHMRSHTREKPFTCTVCAKGFSLMHHMKRHMLSHTGGKPFNCTVCAKGFSTTSNLKTHMRTHTGEKPFACTVCSRGFSEMSTLKKHMRTHSGDKPFTCTVCVKGFGRMDQLKTHMRLHTGEKPFACTVCAKGFTLMHHLKTHMRTHTEADKKQQQSSSDGEPVKKKSRTSTVELQGAPSDKGHSLLGVKGDKSKKKGAGRPKGSKSKEKDLTSRSKPQQDERSSYPAETMDSTGTGAVESGSGGSCDRATRRQ